MSILKKKQPRHEVVSIRLTDERLTLLERFRAALTKQHDREITIAEAAFLVFEDRAPEVDRMTRRQELLQTSTAALSDIRKRWASTHSLETPQWDVLAEYLQIGAEEDRQGAPLLQPAVPSRESCLALVDAFEAVYLARPQPKSRHVWAYVSNLGGLTTGAPLSDTDTDQRNHALLELVAQRRQRLVSAADWEYPGNIGRCLLIAIRDEKIDSARLDQVLAPYWSTLWGLAARGHWIRHDHQPVRLVGPNDDDPRRRIALPDALVRGDLTVSFAPVGTEFRTHIDFGAPRRCGFLITQYPELIEFRAALDSVPDQPWYGRSFSVTVSKEPDRIVTLWLTRPQVHFDFSTRQWADLRDLLRDASQRPELQQWLQALQLEYGEQG